MKKSIVVFFTLLPCLALADTSSTSPTTTSPSTTAHNSAIPDPTQELATMTDRLKLSTAQQDEIRPILVAEAEKKQSIVKDTTLTPLERHQQLGDAHRASLQQIKAYFTPEQMAQIEQGQDHPAPSPTNPDTTASK